MTLAFENQVLDRERRELRRDGQVVTMEPQVFDVLVFMIENRARVVSKDDLIKGVWGGRIVSESTLTSRINSVRKALGDSGEAQRLLKTVPKKGFRFLAEVHEHIPAQADRPTPELATPAVAPPADGPSIAVLPFRNLSGDAEQDYFVDGLVEDVITALSRIPSFFVIARTSSFTYRGRAVDVREVGRELGVRYVVEGSVRRASDRLRITGQLVDTASGSHVWADRYDGSLDDVFELQDRITSSIVGAIEPKVRQAEIARAAAKTTADLDAYDLMLRASALMQQYRRPTHDEALRLLDRALGLDARYSSAYALKARIFIQFKAQNWGPVEEAEAKGLDAARLALETGREDPVSLNHGGGALSYLGRLHEVGRPYIERALELNPNFAAAWRSMGWVDWFLGHPETAIRHLEKARRFSPVDVGAFDGYLVTALAYGSLGRYEEAMQWSDRAVRERPQWAPAHIVALMVRSLAGRPKEELSRLIAGWRRLEPEASLRTVARRFPIEDSAFEPFSEALRKAGLPE